MRFEWDEMKNQLNRKKHGVSFEERWISIGATQSFVILVVVHLFFSDEGEEIIRIVSARHANPKERADYEKY